MGERDCLKDYRRGVETGTMRSATPNVVRQLLDFIDADAADLERLLGDNEKLREWVQRTATSNELCTRNAGYHARRVCLEAGALLAELNGIYGEAAEAARGKGN